MNSVVSNWTAGKTRTEPSSRCDEIASNPTVHNFVHTCITVIIWQDGSGGCRGMLSEQSDPAAHWTKPTTDMRKQKKRAARPPLRRAAACGR